MKLPLQLLPPHACLEKTWLLRTPLFVPSVCGHARLRAQWA
jgi:hypothetical protein